MDGKGLNFSSSKETTDQPGGASEQNASYNRSEQVETSSESFESHATDGMSRKQIEEAFTQIMEDINNKRKEDMNILETIKKEIMAQATLSCQMIEEQMQTMHEAKGKELDEAIQNLAALLDKIRYAEHDLQNSKLSLKTLFTDIQKTAIEVEALDC